MKILSYKYSDTSGSDWSFDKVELSKLNLLVGNSATGKSRFLNTLFNLGKFVASEEFHSGNWELVFLHRNVTYDWRIISKGGKVDNDPGYVEYEKLIKKDSQGDIVLVDRDSNKFMFNGKEMPKLSSVETSISILKEEELIAPVREAFSIILRRNFSHDALSRVSDIQGIPQVIIDNLKKKKDLKSILKGDLRISATLFLLSDFFPEIYQSITQNYKGFFPFIESVRIRDFSKILPSVSTVGEVPVFQIREKKNKNWIPVDQLSSGMQKVLLILTDLFILPEEGVYLIDEYENSLGISAIDFFPDFISDFEKPVQLILTSHHPYLINEIPPENWLIFHREGQKVQIKYGEQLGNRFSKSKQEAFIQLINDPFYSEGVG